MTSISSNHSSNSSILIAAAATSTALLAGALVWKQRQRQRLPRSTLAALQGNSYATASDVLNLYPQAANNKTIVITGTSSGLGNYTAWLLGTKGGGAHVIMGVRNPSAKEVVELLRVIAAAGGTASCWALDLASLESVQEFATKVRHTLATSNRKLDVLINNAGVLGLRGKTRDGYPIIWQVNCMAPALLTELLLPCLAESGRIINVSSEMHKYCRATSIVDVCPPLPASGGSAHADYALSKACQILHAHELNLRGIRAMAVEPGLVQTKVGRHMPQWMIQLEYKLLGPFLMRSLDQGCSSSVFCCLAPNDVVGETSFYFANCAPSQPKANCSSVAEAERLRTLFRGLWKDHLQRAQ